MRQTVIDPTASFRGLDALDRRTAWVAGASRRRADGAVYRTHDGGRTWQDVTPPGAEGLQFRDVEVTGRRTAVVLAIGEGEDSRVYRTTDDGRTWTETFRNTVPAAFYDCLDFYPGGRTGLVMGDPVDGRFQILRTDDGGASWRLLPGDGMPDATGEYGFAASGDCLVVERPHRLLRHRGRAVADLLLDRPRPHLDRHRLHHPGRRGGRRLRARLRPPPRRCGGR